MKINKLVESEEHSVPIVIADDEIILRSVDTRHFYKNKKIKPNIFKPPIGSCNVSVIRFHYVPVTECKRRGKEIASKVKDCCFKGFVALKCAMIKEANVGIKDSREIFLGHADIIYSHPRPPEALPNCAPDDLEAVIEFNEVTKKLLNACKLFLDTAPTSEDWQGDEIAL
ncbi:MAG: hypothetical protein FWH52_02175 [Synergistaceae bacterium]|nr:hypothetical protein [Synergistaceae bacterium]